MPVAIKNPSKKNLEDRARGKKSRDLHKSDPIWLQARRDRFGKAAKLWKLGAFMAYGGLECVCPHKDAMCGPKPIEFLAIDHIRGRRAMGHSRQMGGWRLYMWLKANNYPEGFRVLCHNCNQELGTFKSCPLAVNI